AARAGGVVQAQRRVGLWTRRAGGVGQVHLGEWHPYVGSLAVRVDLGAGGVDVGHEVLLVLGWWVGKEVDGVEPLAVARSAATVCPGSGERMTEPITATPWAPASRNSAALCSSTPPRAKTAGSRSRRRPAWASTLPKPTAPSDGPYPGLDRVGATGDRVT